MEKIYDNQKVRLFFLKKKKTKNYKLSKAKQQIIFE